MNENGFFSTVQVPVVPPGEQFHCSLGVDNNVIVSFEHTQEQPTVISRTFAEACERTNCSTTIKIKNTHPYAIPELVIRDAIPVGKEPYSVILTEPKQLASVEQDGTVLLEDGLNVRWSKEKPSSKDDGLVEWVISKLGSGKERTIKLEWTVECPKGVKWGYSSA